MARMNFAIGDRVLLMDTPHNREANVVGRAGMVSGVSFEDEDEGTHLGYAVTLDGDLTWFVLPDGLRAE